MKAYHGSLGGGSVSGGTILDLEQLDLSHRRKVTSFFRRFPPQISEFTFTNLYVWRGLRPTYVAEVDGSLLFVEENDGERKLLGPPVGGLAPEELPGLLSELGINGADRLDGAAARSLAGAGVAVKEDRDNADYVYLREEMARLEGRRFHRKKNMVNHCLSAYNCQYVEITPEIADEVMAMQERWGAQRACPENRELCAEHNAIREALTHLDKFGLLGGAVRIDGRIQAFTLGEALNDNTAVIHFEKAMTEFQGLYQVINKWFCEFALGDFEFVNREQDLGIRGLRKAKKSYHPHHMVKKFAASWEPQMAPCGCVVLHGRCVEHGVDQGNHA